MFVFVVGDLPGPRRAGRGRVFSAWLFLKGIAPFPVPLGSKCLSLLLLPVAKSCYFHHQVIPQTRTLFSLFLFLPPPPQTIYVASRATTIIVTMSHEATDLALLLPYPSGKQASLSPFVDEETEMGGRECVAVSGRMVTQARLSPKLVLCPCWFPLLSVSREKKELKPFLSWLYLFLQWSTSTWRGKCSIHNPRCFKHLTVGGGRTQFADMSES